MDQTVNLTAQAFEGSNPSLTTNRPYESCNSKEQNGLHDLYVSNELYDVEVLDLKKLRKEGIIELRHV